MSPLYFRVNPGLCHHADSIIGGGEGRGWGVKPRGGGKQVLGESSQNFIDFTIHFILQRKSPFLQNLLWIYGSLRTADVLPVITSLPLKNKFLQRSNDQKYVCSSQARYTGKCVVCFFLLLIR